MAAIPEILFRGDGRALLQGGGVDSPDLGSIFIPGATAAVSSFVASILILALVFLFSLLAFEALRRVHPNFYAARTKVPCETRTSPRPPADGFLAWIPQVWRVPESEIQNVAGMDALAFLRTQRLGLELFGGITLIALITTVPVNLSGNWVSTATNLGGAGAGGVVEGVVPNTPPPPCPPGLECYPSVPLPDTVFTDLDKITMSNITPGSPLLWVHWIVTILITAYTIIIVRKYNLKSVASRLEYLRRTQPSLYPVTSRTLLLTDIPGIPWNTVLDRAVRAVQGPLEFITPKKVSQRLERRLADKFYVGSGISLIRSQSGRLAMEESAGVGRPTPRRRPKSPLSDDDPNAIYDLEDIPELQENISAWPKAKIELQSGLSVEEMIKSELERVHGAGTVACVNVMASQDVLRSLYRKYNRAKEKIARLVERYSAAICRREQRIRIEKVLVYGPAYGTWAVEKFGTQPKFVDSLKFHCMLVEVLAEKLSERRLATEILVEPTAFVTFRSLSTTSAAGTALHHHDASSWQFEPAPEPKDVVWDNLGLRLWERRVRILFVVILFLLICAFYVIPVAALQSVLAQDLLLNNPLLFSLTSQPTVRNIILQIIPSLVLSLVLLIAPPLLGKMCRWSGSNSVSRITFDTVNLYFIFKVVVLFIGSLVSGAVIYFSVLTTLISRPSAIFEILGATAPRQSFFFITFILTQAVTIRGLVNLLGPLPLLMYTLRTSGTETLEARQKACRGTFPAYDWEIPTDTLAILLGLVFSVQNPIMPLAALIFFMISGTVARYNWVYIYYQQFQAGGMVWSTISDHILAGLTIFLIFMIGYLQLLAARVQSTLLLLPLALVLIFWLNTKRQLGYPQRFLSMSEAVIADEKFDELESGQDIRAVFLPPFMMDDKAELTALLENALRVRNALIGDMQATREILKSFTREYVSSTII